MSDLSDQLEVDFGTAILEDLTGEESLTRKGQRVRLFDQSINTAEAYYPADENGKAYVQNFQEGRRWYPITAYCKVYAVDWRTALQQLRNKYIGVSTKADNKRGHRVRPSISLSPKPPASYHDPTFVNQTQTGYERNNFALFLNRLLGIPVANELLTLFHVGTWPGGVAREWQRCTVYWQVDEQERVHAGKVMYYHQGAGKRIKDECPDFAMPTWAHKLMGLNNFNLEQCLFGLHQLRHQPLDKPIAIVESEKTAIICTAFQAGFIWLACGGKGNLHKDKLNVLTGRTIVLFPDLGGFTEWTVKADELIRMGYAVSVSRILEDRASSLERHSGLDLADFLTRYRCDQTGRVIVSPDGPPALGDYELVNIPPIVKSVPVNRIAMPRAPFVWDAIATLRFIQWAVIPEGYDEQNWPSEVTI